MDKFRVRLVSGEITQVERCARNAEIEEVLAFPDGFEDGSGCFEECLRLKSVCALPKTLKECKWMCFAGAKNLISQ